MIPLLIVAYQRPDNVRLILEKSYRSGVRIFYISLDAPRNDSAESRENNEAIRKDSLSFARENHVQLYLREFSKNVGCGVAVLTACDWFFSENHLGVVLEDDCIPGEDFFKFMSFALETLSNNSEIMMASGTQRAPSGLFTDLWHLDTYPVFWGWGTTASKWRVLAKEALDLNPESEQFRNFFDKEKTYWGAGVRRVLEGYVDTWDTLISAVFFLNQFKNLSPAKSLVNNVGNDAHATHPMDFLDREIHSVSSFPEPDSEPIFQPAINRRIAVILYNIGFRHLASTRITKLIDAFRSSSLRNNSLRERYAQSTSYYSQVVKVG